MCGNNLAWSERLTWHKVKEGLTNAKIAVPTSAICFIAPVMESMRCVQTTTRILMQHTLCGAKVSNIY